MWRCWINWRNGKKWNQEIIANWFESGSYVTKSVSNVVRNGNTLLEVDIHNIPLEENDARQFKNSLPWYVPIVSLFGHVDRYSSFEESSSELHISMKGLTNVEVKTNGSILWFYPWRGIVVMKKNLKRGASIFTVLKNKHYLHKL